MTFLYVLLCVIAVTLILLCIRVVAVINYEEEFSFTIKWLFLKFVVYPPKPKKEKPEEKKEKPKEEKKKKEKTRKSNPFLDFYHNQGVSGVLELISSAVSAVKGMFRRLFKAVVIRDLSIFMRISGEDAAQTAIAYGKVCAAVFPAVGAVSSVVKIKNRDIRIEPDFQGGTAQASFSVVAAVIPLRVLAAAIIVLVQLLFKVVLKLFIGSRSKEEKQSKKQTK